MPRGDKSSYSGKQRRKAEHIEESYESRGVGKKEAERRAWATVNKEEGGGKKSGSGRAKKSTAKKSTRQRTAKKSTAKKRTAKKSAAKKRTAKKSTRKRSR